MRTVWKGKYSLRQVINHYFRFMNYVKLIFDLAHPDDADILSALLNDMDCQGIEENDTQLLVFFDEGLFDEAAIRDVLVPFSFLYTKEIMF